ncbi:hypothetical protein BDK51DRAFT_52549 [Blyttiomyces helicus]|uniref:Uncharacterized protein n=1 Tax=Blyttiomyces helicus TaxID=388810 RepID=A0A4P9WPT1_9FUNG|nr:hypothetical protein BDK51DRAFT_52549 [Blyttiomyces helicus]|eukprot:RKO94345.1 hypothetical protein BDK51DRAFT_52549 [Blyttiomyces helicus]
MTKPRTHQRRLPLTVRSLLHVARFTRPVALEVADDKYSQRLPSLSLPPSSPPNQENPTKPLSYRKHPAKSHQPTKPDVTSTQRCRTTSSAPSPQHVIPAPTCLPADCPVHQNTVPATTSTPPTGAYGNQDVKDSCCKQEHSPSTTLPTS